MGFSRLFAATADFGGLSRNRFLLLTTTALVYVRVVCDAERTIQLQENTKVLDVVCLRLRATLRTRNVLQDGQPVQVNCNVGRVTRIQRNGAVCRPLHYNVGYNHLWPVCFHFHAFPEL